MNREKIYFVGLCSQGQPFDSGFNLMQNKKNIENLLSPFFDEIVIYTPSSLKMCEGSEGFCNPMSNELHLNPGFSSVGGGDFKYYIIDKTLKEIEEGSFILYHDCHFSKYVQYWQTDWDNLHDFFNFVLDQNDSDFFFAFESFPEGLPNLVGQHGKRYVTDYIIGDPVESEIVSRCREIAAGRMIIKNTKKSREFFADLKKLSYRKDFFSKFPNPNPYPEFTHTTADQHVLNCLTYKYILDGKLNPDFPKFVFNDRKWRLNSDLKIIKNPELTKYMLSKSIKNIINELKDDKDIRGSQEFREDIFST